MDAVNKKITFLIGAGAESSDNYNLPTGAEFKKQIIMSKNVNTIFKAINKNEKIKLNNEILIKYNSTSTLYQTLVEHRNSNENVENLINKNSCIREYLNYKKGSKSNEETIVSQKFHEFFREEIYDKLKKADNDIENNDALRIYLDNLSFCSFVDSLFNYLRYYDNYPNECSKVVKIYYSAFLSVASHLGVDDKFLNNLKDNDVIENRKKLIDMISLKTDEVIKDKDSENNYYNIIRKIFMKKTATLSNKDESNVHIIITNYTQLCKKATNIDDNNIAYVHGRLDLFENLYTKEVKKLTEFDADNIVFPYLMIQSGVKPIFSSIQINEWYKAVSFIEKSEYVIVIGFGINSDDDHITTILREKAINKKFIFFLYSKTNNVEELKKEKERILKILKNPNNIYFFKSNEFEKVLKKIKENEELNSSIL